MKIIVYAICKNESKFVDCWMDSMTEADAVVVLDTGSSDDTVEKLRRRGAIVERAEIFPWRFDTARNRSLALVPDDADICVCTDLDEAFHPGWRAASMRYIAKSYAHKGDFPSARRYFLRVIAEAPHLREGYMDLATTLYEREDWPGVVYFTACALEITERPATYICEAAAWGALPHDLRAIAFHRLGQILLALEEAEAALALAPSDPRLQGNAALLRKAANAIAQHQ